MVRISGEKKYTHRANFVKPDRAHRVVIFATAQLSCSCKLFVLANI